MEKEHDGFSKSYAAHLHKSTSFKAKQSRQATPERQGKSMARVEQLLSSYRPTSRLSNLDNLFHASFHNVDENRIGLGNFDLQQRKRPITSSIAAKTRSIGTRDTGTLADDSVTSSCATDYKVVPYSDYY